MAAKPRILFILHLPPPLHGASAVGAAIQGSALINDAFETRYINLATSVSMSHIGRFAFSKIGRFRVIRRQVKAAVREFRPDAIYFTPTSRLPMLWKDYLIARLFLGKPIPLMIHLHNSGVKQRKDAFPDRVIYRKLFRNARVIAPAEAMWEEVEAFVPRERFTICNNAAEDMEGGTHASGAIPTILFLSNLLPKKGVSTLLDACAILKRQSLAFRCVFYGAETEEISAGRFESLVAERQLQDCVAYRGPVEGEAKKKAYCEADIFALPTQEDVFPLVLIEAMSAGLPVVSTLEGGIPEMVVEGETGFLCPSRSVEALADRLEQLLQDQSLRSRMALAARKRYEQHYTPEVFQRRMLEVLTRMVNKS